MSVSNEEDYLYSYNQSNFFRREGEEYDQGMLSYNPLLGENGGIDNPSNDPNDPNSHFNPINNNLREEQKFAQEKLGKETESTEATEAITYERNNIKSPENDSNSLDSFYFNNLEPIVLDALRQEESPKNDLVHSISKLNDCSCLNPCYKFKKFSFQKKGRKTFETTTFTQIKSLKEVRKRKTKKCLILKNLKILKNKDKELDNQQRSIENCQSNSSQLNLKLKPSDDFVLANVSPTFDHVSQLEASKVKRTRKNFEYRKSLQEVINMLKRWHELRNGLIKKDLGNGKTKKLSGEEAAKELNFPSKSLDYYKLIITKFCALKNTFDIREYLTESFGNFYRKISSLLFPEKAKAKVKLAKQAKLKKEKKEKQIRQSRKNIPRPSAHGENEAATKSSYFKILQDFGSL